MLSFDLRTLDRHAEQVDAVLAGDDPIWEPGDPRPPDGVRVHGRLSNAGTGRYYFHGQLQGLATMECRRCLAPASAEVDEPASFVYAEAGDTEMDEDPDVFLIPPHAQELDLRPAVREQWLLASPAYLECRPDCKGLCPTCGAELNAGPCGCTPAADPRWDALRPHRDRRP